VLPARKFWDSFALASDGLFFPKFDQKSVIRERSRILNEIKQTATPLSIDNHRFYELLWRQDYTGYLTIGTREQVESYTQEDFVACHQRGYNLHNTCVAITGDINHAEATERVSEILNGAPCTPPNLPNLGECRVHKGEFRRHTDGANEGYTEAHLIFEAVQANSDQFFPTLVAVDLLSDTIQDKLTERFGLYAAHMGCGGWPSKQPSIGVTILTGQKENASAALEYALEIIMSPQTLEAAASNHEDLVARKIQEIEVEQPTLEQLAVRLNNCIGGEMPLFSPADRIEKLQEVEPDQVRDVIKALRTSSMFLNVRGHAGALDAVPPIDVIDAWRAEPAALAAIKTSDHKKMSPRL
jgi:predicted Zn-dependent peptidase